MSGNGLSYYQDLVNKGAHLLVKSHVWCPIAKTYVKCYAGIQSKRKPTLKILIFVEIHMYERNVKERLTYVCAFDQHKWTNFFFLWSLKRVIVTKDSLKNNRNIIKVAHFRVYNFWGAHY